MRNWLTQSFWPRLREIAVDWQTDDGATLAAATAYYATFSLFPLLLLAVAALGYALRFSTGAQNAQQELLHLAAKNVSPALATRLQELLGQISDSASLGGPLALAALLLAGIGVFTQLEIAFDRIWKTPSPEWRGLPAAIRNALWFRLRAFLMLLGAGVLLLLAFGADIAAATFRAMAAQLPVSRWTWNLAETALSVALFTAFFTVVYKALPRARVRWLHAMQGGLLAAVFWEITRQLLSYFLVGEAYTAYGVVGSLIVFMLWIYVACGILFLGAEYVQVVGRAARARSPENE